MDANVQALANGSDLGEQIRKLMEENAKLKAKVEARQTLTFKVSEKGAISIYGMGRFPVTMYVSQFDRLAKVWPDLLDWVEENRSKLATKD